MFGLTVLVVLALYLWLLVWATKRGWRWGVEKKGWTGKKRWLGAAMGFLIVYLPVFWDFIPTVAVHQYYCAKDSGFWVYKTLEQWKKENPGVMEGLVANKNAPSTRQGDMENYTDTYFLNQRINKIIQQQRVLSLLSVNRHEETLVDHKTNEVLARYVDFGSYNREWGGLKSWTSIQHCSDGENNYGNFLLFKRLFQGAEK
jgi:hypothetical protein